MPPNFEPQADEPEGWPETAPSLAEELADWAVGPDEREYLYADPPPAYSADEESPRASLHGAASQDAEVHDAPPATSEPPAPQQAEAGTADAPETPQEPLEAPPEHRESAPAVAAHAAKPQSSTPVFSDSDGDSETWLY